MKSILKWPFAALFVVSGYLHFTRSEIYLRLMPPALPYHKELVAISGAVELALGCMLLVPRTQKQSAWGLLVTLIAIFPANVYAAMSAGTPHEAMPGISPWLAWGRLPVQPLLVAWAYWYTRNPTRSNIEVDVE